MLRPYVHPESMSVQSRMLVCQLRFVQMFVGMVVVNWFIRCSTLLQS